MTKKKSHSKSSTKGSSTNPQPALKSALFQGSTPIQNVKKANQSAPKLPSPPELRQSTSINSDRTASQQDFPTLPSKPDKAKSFSSKDSPPSSSPKIAAPITAVPTLVPFIANIQDSIQDARNVKSVETSPLLPAQPVHVNILPAATIQSSQQEKSKSSNAHIISLTRYIIAMLLISIVIVSLWFLSGIGFPWFIFPLFLLAALFQIRFFQLRSVHLKDHDKAINWLLLHSCISLSFFATSLVSWAYLYPLWSFPWILYVMAFQFFLLVAHIGRVSFKWNYLTVHMWTYLTASCLLILTWYLTKLYIKEYVLGIAIYGTLLILGMAARKVYYLNKPSETKSLESVIVIDDAPLPQVIDKNQDGLYQIVTFGSQDYSSFPTLTKSKTTSTTSFSAKYEHLKGERPEAKYQTSKF